MIPPYEMIRLCLVGSVAAALVPHAAGAVEKEVSLVTKQPTGALAVAGRLSVDLHAAFMLSRTYETDAALNWYNCGYSGGGAGGSKVGGGFGHFGFQVPFAERELRYPRAVSLGEVRAVRFDGDDFLKGNVAIEPAILESGRMAVEVWFRVPEAVEGVLLGWQSVDGRESSAPLALPPGLKAGGEWRHLVVNCSPEGEEWHVDGVKLAEGPRKLLPQRGHVMVLGGAGSKAPSFRGEIAAVRLHDERMSDAEIQHNFKGGPNLGTEMHNWWRNEPDKYWIQESAHFRHAVDKQEMSRWSEQQLADFHKRVPEMFELAELCYAAYTERLALRSSVVSVLPEERGDGIKYKIAIQPSEGSWMGFDGHFGWACQGAGFINPHELVHGFQAMTGNMAGNYWEVHANFPQTYVGIYQTIPVIMAESSSFPASGRTYYHDRSMFEHLAQTPEYGPMFISKLWYDGTGTTEAEKSPYPWITFEKLNPYADRSLADEFARMAMRNVTWDYQTFEEFRPGMNYRDPMPAAQSPYVRTAEANRTDTQQSLLRSRVLLEPVTGESGWWRVPRQQAPQQFGWNICPLECKPGKVVAELSGYRDETRGGGWRAGFVGVKADGKPVYGKVFQPGAPQEFEVTSELKELYLVVCATPTKVLDIPMTGDFRSFEQEPFPYKVRLAGSKPLDVLAAGRREVAGKPHANGGGLVADSATVEPGAYVGPNARVLGSSKVLGNARIEDHAVIVDSTVKDQAVVSGHALVYEGSTVAERAKVRDYAVIKGRTTIGGNARVLEHAVVATGKTCTDHVVVKGIASVYGGNQRGTAMIDGFYAKGNEISQGKWFTWSWGQGKNPGEEDVDFSGLYADYDFASAHGWMARDAFGVTWGYLGGGAKAGQSDGSGKNGLRLDGASHYVELPKDIADMEECTYTAEVLWDGKSEGARLFEFAADNGDAVRLTPSSDGKMVFAIRKGGQTESVSAPAPAKGTWAKIQVMVEGNSARLYLNDKQVGENQAMTLKPADVRATRCYLGRGADGGFLGGMIARFTVHSIPLVDRKPPLPDPAVFEMSPMFISPGALVMTAAPGSDPLGSVEYWFEEQGGQWNSGWIKERTVQLDGRSASKPLLYRFKMRDKNGNETAHSAPARSGGYPKGTPVLIVPASGPAVLEAEHFLASVPAADGSTQWEKRSDGAGFVGEGFVAVPDAGRRNVPFQDTAARLDYAVHFQNPGRYYLWVRANGNNDGGASIHAGLGLKPAPWGTGLRTGHGRYGWTRTAAFDIDKAGGHLFSIWMCEDGAMVDRMLFTADEKFEPSPGERAGDQVMTGSGPQESTRHPAP